MIPCEQLRCQQRSISICNKMNLFSKAGYDSSNSISPQLLFEILKQPLTAFLHISPGCIEIASVPRVGYLAGMVGKVQQQMHFVGKIAAADAIHTLQVGMVHSNQEVVLLVVAVHQLSSSLAGAIDSMLGQLAASLRIHRIADLLGAGGCRSDMELPFQARFLHQVFHHILGHRTPANIAVTHKKNPRHPISPVSVCHSQYNMCQLKRRVPFFRVRNH